MTFLYIYGAVNMLALVGGLMVLYVNYYDFDDVFYIYPELWTALDEHEINLAGKVSLSTLISLVFAPAIIAYFAILGISIGIVFLGSWGFKLFCKIFKKKVD
jgi:hypothetical protein